MERQRLQYRSDLKSLARELRGKQTEAESLLWSRLRRKQLLGIQFYRQRPIGRYIVDFFAPRVNLVIEVDGGQHLDDMHKGKDQQRDDFLASRGLTVLRFDNLEVLGETTSVMERAFSIVRVALRKSPPTPL